jgi:hypothetical protein
VRQTKKGDQLNQQRAASRFVSGRAVWPEIRRAVATSSPVRAAIAYLGKGAADQLPLKPGDSLLVDVSSNAVRHGVTDPSEVLRLQEGGVTIYNRSSLHAKFVIAGGILVVGSANASARSESFLDEAALITGDATAVRAALAHFTSLSTEPIGPAFLRERIREYRPPRFLPGGRRSTRPRRRAKLWYLGRVGTYEPVGADAEVIEAIEAQTREEHAAPVREGAGKTPSAQVFSPAPSLTLSPPPSLPSHFPSAGGAGGGRSAGRGHGGRMRPRISEPAGLAAWPVPSRIARASVA